MVVQHPGLTNPDISKVIGIQWRNQSQETKNEWKALAEQEKLQHQLQYPTYRYQPKRIGRKQSVSSDPVSADEKTACNKCGGRTFLEPSIPYAPRSQGTGSIPPTPESATISVSKWVPALHDLNLQSPAGQLLGRITPGAVMSPDQHYANEHNDLEPLSNPDWKRRRGNTSDHLHSAVRIMPPRYTPAGTPVGPGTPFPFHQGPGLQHPYPAAMAHSKRESLPKIRSVINPPGPMGPPPRPRMGYSQHRVSQGHVPHDRTLTLPPLQTGQGPALVESASIDQTHEEQIMNMPFRYKITVLGRIARPACGAKDNTRGPLIAIEGDNAGAVQELGRWLTHELAKSPDLEVHMISSPDVNARLDTKNSMIQYHQLMAEWLAKSDEVVRLITRKTVMTPVDTTMHDISPPGKGVLPVRELAEDYDDDGLAAKQAGSRPRSSNGTVEMDNPAAPRDSTSNGGKPIAIIPNYSLHASNVFACRIPVDANEAYSSSDHWSWTATQWRGVVGPDLTVFVRDSTVVEPARSAVEMLEEGNLFFVKRTSGDKGLELEASTLRRLGFEISEWICAFGKPEGK